jgi:hypothetical protein
VNDLTVVTPDLPEPISLARRALAEATTLPDMKDVRSWAEALRAYAKSRGMGIEAENQAAEVVIRAERKMGTELIRMAEAGERTVAGTGGSRLLGRIPGLPAGERKAFTAVVNAGGATLAGMGVTPRQSSHWQRLATIDDEMFESLVVELLSREGARLSRMDFVRAYFGPDKKYPKEALHDDGDEWTAGWERMVEGSALLGKALDGGWPIQSDRTLRGWGEINDQITAVGRNLLLLQKRVAGHMAALGVRSTADTPEVPRDD